MTNRLKNSQFFRLFGCLWKSINRIWNGMKSKNFNRKQKIRLQVFEFEFFFEFDRWFDHFFNFRFQNLKKYVWLIRNNLTATYRQQNQWQQHPLRFWLQWNTTKISRLVILSPSKVIFKSNKLIWSLPELSWGEIDLNWRFPALYFLK